MKHLASLLVFSLLSAISATGFAASETVTLSVPGMNCPVCPITVKKALEKVDGVIEVAVNYDRKETKVTFDNAKASVDALTHATANAGYPSSVKAHH